VSAHITQDNSRGQRISEMKTIMFVVESYHANGKRKSGSLMPKVEHEYLDLHDSGLVMDRKQWKTK
jgi:hypothetical protein